VLYVLSFRFLWNDNRRPDLGEGVSLYSPFWWRLVVLTMGAVTFAGARWMRVREAGMPIVLESLAIFTLLGIAWGLAYGGAEFLLPAGDVYPPAAIVFNLLLFAAELGVVAEGYLRRRAALVNTGMLFFGVHLFTRYFDIFGRLLHTSLVFVGAGLLLLIGGAYLERTRRHLVARMPEEPA
jgi:uncharacterized membrane protein